jgi:hypothetical protein
MQKGRELQEILTKFGDSTMANVLKQQIDPEFN